MYVIIVYDVGEKRVGKMLKLCRQYLCWIQNSVLEGELSEAKLRELQMKMKAIIDESEDSVIVFTNKMGYNMNKQILGKEKNVYRQFLIESCRCGSILSFLVRQNLQKLLFDLLKPP